MVFWPARAWRPLRIASSVPFPRAARVLETGFVVPALLACFAGTDAIGAEASQKHRRSAPADFDVDVERYPLPNGMTVLLAPDPRAESIFVATQHPAGALQEPLGKSGLAHFVEHLLATGTEVDRYAQQAEARGALFFNAVTGPTFMRFEVELPPEELPFALWMKADRLAGRSARIEPELFERERAVIRVERSMRAVDRPFAVADQAILDTLFPPDHRFHGGVLGTVGDLGSITLDDVKRFSDAWIQPQGAILVIAGRFDPTVARQLVAETLGQVPGKPLPPRDRSRALQAKAKELQAAEVWSRRPRVSLVWKLRTPNVATTREALELGALLIAGYVDGSFGAQVETAVIPLDTETLFRLDVVLPHDKPIESARGEAEVFLRYLTGVEMPSDF